MFNTPGSRLGHGMPRQRRASPLAQTAWMGAQSFPIVSLVDQANIIWQANLAQKAKVILGGNRVFNAVLGVVEGTTYYLWVIQDGTGTRIPTFTTSGTGSFDFGATGVPTFTTTASRADLLVFESVTIAGTLKLRYCGIAKGFA